MGELAKAGHTSAVRAVGLSGQMHGADAARWPMIVRFGRRSSGTTGAAPQPAVGSRPPSPSRVASRANLAMPGFTAPKIVWLRENEPEVAAKLRRVLLPKDYVRLRLTGEAISDCSGRFRHALARCGQARLVVGDARGLRPR